MVESARVKWCGGNPTNCELCGNVIRNSFVDGKTKAGPWAIMCLDCAVGEVLKFGTGTGQQYVRHEDTNEFWKLRG